MGKYRIRFQDKDFSIIYYRITCLQHKDRILFGANHLYVFINPNNEQDLSSIITWEYCTKRNR